MYRHKFLLVLLVLLDGLQGADAFAVVFARLDAGSVDFTLEVLSHVQQLAVDAYCIVLRDLIGRVID